MVFHIGPEDIGYWQVGLHQEDKEKTVFSTSSGLFQFNVMPFGLCNAPVTFERLMDLVPVSYTHLDVYKRQM